MCFEASGFRNNPEPHVIYNLSNSISNIIRIRLQVKLNTSQIIKKNLSSYHFIPIIYTWLTNIPDNSHKKRDKKPWKISFLLSIPKSSHFPLKGSSLIGRACLKVLKNLCRGSRVKKGGPNLKIPLQMSFAPHPPKEQRNWFPFPLQRWSISECLAKQCRSNL